jgi:hypothetical protein
MFAALVPTAACVDYDPRLTAPLADGGIGQRDDFSPTPCERPGEARVSVEGYAYHILCGCVEVEGSMCTIAPRTTVVWTFADSAQHNVTSVLDRFGASGDLLAGEFSHLFSEPGEYRYGCSIHAADMSGYRIVVTADGRPR